MVPNETIELYDILGHLNSPIHHIGGLEATQELLQMIEVGEDSYILDVACGSGFTVCGLAKNYGYRVVGIDASEVMISKARERAKKQKVEHLVEFRLADLYSLPFEDGRFNVALFESVLNVLTGNRQKALDEIVRVVCSEGLIAGNEFIVVPDTPPEIIQRYSDVAPFLGDPLTKEKLENMFESSNLKNIRTKEYPASHITGRMVYSQIIETIGIKGLLSYLIRMSYYSIRYSKLRLYSKYSRLVVRNKKTRKFFGYILIIGQK